MGATNAMLAYRLYAGRVPATSMQLLAFMALVSRDDDDRPWYGQGHEALAVHALGRQAPATRADIAAVERAITPLKRIKAIEVDRRAAVRRDGPSTVRYRLRLVASGAESIDTHAVDNTERDDSLPTETVSHAPRKPCSRPTETVTTSHGNHGTEEPRGTTRSEIEENHLDQEGYSLPSTAALDATPDIDASHSNGHTAAALTDPDACDRCGVLLDPDRRCRNRQCRDPTLAEIIPLRPTA